MKKFLLLVFLLVTIPLQAQATEAGSDPELFGLTPNMGFIDAASKLNGYSVIYDEEAKGYVFTKGDNALIFDVNGELVTIVTTEVGAGTAGVKVGDTEIEIEEVLGTPWRAFNSTERLGTRVYLYRYRTYALCINVEIETNRINAIALIAHGWYDNQDMLELNSAYGQQFLGDTVY